VPWARLDDDFFDHPKVEPLSDKAFRSYVGGLCLCNRYLSDGRLTAFQVAKIAKPAQRDELLRAGLWEQDEGGGVLVHDFLDYNRTAEAIKAERKRNAERQARLREQRRSGGSNGVTDDATNAVSPDAPFRPDPFVKNGGGSEVSASSSDDDPTSTPDADALNGAAPADPAPPPAEVYEFSERWRRERAREKSGTA
jgi:hypothetical protein